MTSRVLIVKLDAVGDVLRTTALLPAVRAAYPGCHVTWLTRPAAAPLFTGNDLVDEVLTTDSAIAVARLAREEFDVVLCPDADPDAARLAGAARGRERRGFTSDERGWVQPLGPGAERWFRMGLHDAEKKANTDTYQSLVARVLELDPAAVEEPILVPSDADERDVTAWRQSLGFAGPLVGLNTGAGGRWEHKQWTQQHQEAFIAAVTARGAGVVLLGGPEEGLRHRELMAAAAELPVFDAGNDNSYSRFAALVSQCSAVVTGDTFALHVAVARKVPVVALFGPTSHAEIELYGRGEKIVPDLDCLGCYLPTCDVVPHCQELIEPARVVDAVARWVDSLA